jgi:hypothetical protein
MTRREYYNDFASRLGSLNATQLKHLKPQVVSDSRLRLVVDNALSAFEPRIAAAPEEIRTAYVPPEEIEE